MVGVVRRFGRRREADDPAAARRRMVDRLRPRIDRESTAAAMLAVARHEFVPEADRTAAYADRPLPIEGGQTISAPHMVAMMTDALGLEPGERVLEVGTGCGYHAAVTAEIVGAENVFTIEFDASLAEAARERLDGLGYGAVRVRAGDGHEGWAEHAPYDAAYLTCAAERIPEAVIEQVRDGGRVLAPVGASSQHLVYGEKRDGDLRRERRTPVRFVPMRGGG